jgi:hypothetical protein
MRTPCRIQHAFPTLSYLAILLLLLLLRSTPGIGRMLDPNELLIGTWNVHLHCPEHCFHSRLFPQQQELVTAVPNQQRRFRSAFFTKQHPCRLHMYSNRTFHLQPYAEQNHRILEIRGKWKVHANPYCVTDRYYDEVVLTSYTRMQTASSTTLQTGKVRMQCRLMGHFSPGRWVSRRWYGKGRLTRGVVVWEDCRNKRHKTFVCASFSAQRWIPSLFHLYGTNEGTVFDPSEVVE